METETPIHKQKTYLVTISETVSKKYYIKANSEEEAEEKVFTHDILFKPDEEECVEREISDIEIY
tara:strand:- start:824 stop:1018 length:195 start_codon:yes stop_codon:yes gene_type:complete